MAFYSSGKTEEEHRLPQSKEDDTREDRVGGGGNPSIRKVVCTIAREM